MADFEGFPAEAGQSLQVPPGTIPVPHSLHSNPRIDAYAIGVYAGFRMLGKDASNRAVASLVGCCARTVSVRRTVLVEEGFLAHTPSSVRGPWGHTQGPITSETRLRIFRRDGFTCRYCQRPGGDLTLDHVDPDGGDSDRNLVTACRSCNSSKGRRTPQQAGMELSE